MAFITDKIMDLCTTNISRKLLDGVLFIGQKRIELELINYLLEKGTEEKLQIVLFDYYMYCYIYQYGKFEYDSWYHKFDLVFLKQFYMRNKYGMEEAYMVKYNYVEPKIERMFKHFCNSLVEEEIVIKDDFEEFLQTASFNIAPTHHKFEGLSRNEILSKQGFEGIEDYLKTHYSNCESFIKFPNYAYYKSYFNL